MFFLISNFFAYLQKYHKTVTALSCKMKILKIEDQ